MQAGRLRFSSRGERLQAPYIHRIDGYVGLHSRCGRGPHGGLVVGTRLGYSVAEVDEALFLGELAQRLHQRLQSQQFAVRAERVEIRVVSRKGSARFCCAFRASRVAVFKSLALAGVVRGKGRQQFGLVVSEIQVHMHVRCERYQGH